MALQWDNRPYRHEGNPIAGPSTIELGGANPAQSMSPLHQRRRVSAAHRPPVRPPPSSAVPRIPQNLYSQGLDTSIGSARQNLSHSIPSTLAGPSAPLSPQYLREEPRSLPSPRARPASPPRQIPPDLHLLAAPPRPSRRSWSRRALTRALELAREAVTYDQNEEPHKAVVAYGRSVQLLAEVMDRVRSGESTESRRPPNGRETTTEDREGEIQRLNDIYNTYRDRMEVLSLVYGMPPIPHSPPLTQPMTISIHAEPPPSPTTSDSPTSAISSAPESPDTPDTEDSRSQDIDVLDGVEAIGFAMFDMVEGSQPGTAKTARFPPHEMGLSSHPYAAAYKSSVPAAVTPPPTISRSHTLSSLRARGRAPSTLPPPPPPPSNALPPAPGQLDLSLQELPPPPRFEPIPREEVSTKPRPLFERTHTLPMPKSPRFVASDSYIDHPLPPLPRAEPVGDVPRARTISNPAHPVPRQFPSDKELINNLIHTTTAGGTIATRRSKSSAPASAGSSPSESHLAFSNASVTRLTASVLPTSTANSLGMCGRSRAASQPGRRPPIVAGKMTPVPPLPVAFNGSLGAWQPSFPSRLGPNAAQSLAIHTVDLSPKTPTPNSGFQLIPPPGQLNHLPTTPTSPLPSLPPQDVVRKPYHLMNLIRITMTSKTGGYITRRLHVPLEVWSQGGANLPNLVDKVRIVEVLCASLEDLQNTSVDYFGAGNVSSGMALGIGSVGRKEGEAWLSKLEEFSQLCDGLVTSFGKKLGVGEGIAAKKSTAMSLWTTKFTRRLNTLTNAKNLDLPAAYVTGLSKLFAHAQLLDEHTKALCSTPVAPAYAAFPPDIRASAEAKLKRSSEFFASVVLTFCTRDLSTLLDKYAKKCERWLED